MKERIIILSNAFLLALLGIRIELCNRLLTLLFRKRKMLNLCRRIDRHLVLLRKEFIILERRHLSVICLDI
ncbi:MAG: hypothetical protein IJB74_06970 [Clostridia bacterium]|nr:hypothetical protein [Clostridia bacterium]